MQTRRGGRERAASKQHSTNMAGARQEIRLMNGLRVGLLNWIKMLTSLFQLVAGEIFKDLVYQRNEQALAPDNLGSNPSSATRELNDLGQVQPPSFSCVIFKK